MTDKLSKNVIIKEGRVTEALPNAFFKVKLDDDSEVVAHLSGRMRINHIKVLAGDRVSMELNEYSKNRGRIVKRF